MNDKEAVKNRMKGIRLEMNELIEGKELTIKNYVWVKAFFNVVDAKILPDIDAGFDIPESLISYAEFLFNGAKERLFNRN